MGDGLCVLFVTSFTHAIYFVCLYSVRVSFIHKFIQENIGVLPESLQITNASDYVMYVSSSTEYG